MDIGDSPEEAAFRAEARAWLEQHATPLDDGAASPRGATALRGCRSTWTARAPGSAPSSRRVGPASRCRRSTAGGAGPACNRRSSTRSRRGSTSRWAPSRWPSRWSCPTLIAHGTEQQKKEHIDAILRGDELWCQLYSEPGAGSDLASLGTRAVLDGDEYVVNGQKVWNSFAQFADYGILLARTDPDAAEAPRHHVLRRRHEDAGHRRATAGADHRRRALQRGLPHRRAHPGRQRRSAT